jgi:streptogramin lyase
MRPAIDHEGRLWFGEMGHNYLAVFDPHTQTFQQIIPPHGRSGIMGVLVAPDDTIWFAEQYANYIGHYLPATRQFHIYPLPTVTTPNPGNSSQTLTLPSGPNDLAIDTRGNLWFTELNADSLARLDPATGNVRQYPLSSKKSVQTLDPYGITVDPHGMIWFTEATNDHVGRLDPATGSIRYFTMQGPNIALMEIASDPHGMIWITSFSSGLLLSLDPGTGTFHPYYVPFPNSNVEGLYGLTITPSGEIWITVTSANVIARLDVPSNRFIYYSIPTSGGGPLGIVMGGNHTFWFTEAGSDKIGVLQP